MENKIVFSPSECAMPTLIPTKTPYLYIVKVEPHDKPTRAEIERQHINWLGFNGHFVQFRDEKRMASRTDRVYIRPVNKYEKHFFESGTSGHLTVLVRILPSSKPPCFPKQYVSTADKLGHIVVKRVFITVEKSTSAIKEVARLQSILGKVKFRERVEEWVLNHPHIRNGTEIIPGDEFFAMLNEA